MSALLTCLRDNLEAVRRADELPSSLSDVVRALVRYHREHRRAMPDVTTPNLKKGKHDPATCPGYLKGAKSDGIELLLPSRAFAEAMTNIAPPEEAKTLLREAGLVVVQREGPNARISVKRTIGELKDGSKWEVSVMAIKLDKVLAKT